VDLTAYLEQAETAARAAGAIIQDYRGRFEVEEKARADLVTSADPAAQAAIIDSLRSRFPDHTFLGEEKGAEPDPAIPFRWVIDPLDGTTNYAHGFPFYAVSIALEVHGELAVGVVYDPSRDELFRAAKGLGAFCNGKPMKVSATSQLTESLLATGFPPLLGTENTARALADLFILFARKCHSVLRLGSAALSLAYAAAGRLDGVYAYNWKPWDSAAGVVLVREAGGRITNTDGSPVYDLYRPDILCSNGPLHDEMASMLSATVAEGILALNRRK